jgi:hypothetical protein
VRLASSILSAATCVSEKIAAPVEVNIPSFIKIKELPQTKDRKNSKIQFWYVKFMARSYIKYLSRTG